MLHPSDPGSRECAPQDFGRLTGLSCLPRRAPASRAAGPGGGCCAHAGGAVAAGGAGCCGGGARPGIVGVGAAHCLRHRPLRQADAAGARAYVLEFRLGQGRARACAERGGRGQWRHAVWPVGKFFPGSWGKALLPCDSGNHLKLQRQSRTLPPPFLAASGARMRQCCSSATRPGSAQFPIQLQQELDRTVSNAPDIIPSQPNKQNARSRMAR